MKEIIIPLASDTMFFEVLMHALQTLGTQLNAVSDEFMANLSTLSRSISSAAKPMSSTNSSFQPHSNASNPASVSVMTPSSIVQIGHQKSDLYSWREIFQLYVDAEVFESHSEKTRGERGIEDAEERLELFKQRLAERGMSEGKALKLKQSRDALQTFLALNSFILDLKRVGFKPFPFVIISSTHSSNSRRRRPRARFSKNTRSALPSPSPRPSPRASTSPPPPPYSTLMPTLPLRSYPCHARRTAPSRSCLYKPSARRCCPSSRTSTTTRASSAPASRSSPSACTADTCSASGACYLLPLLAPLQTLTSVGV